MKPLYFFIFITALLYSGAISAKTASVTVTIWAHNSIRQNDPNKVLELKVFIDGKQQHGLLLTAFDDAPKCGARGTVSAKVPEGAHQIEVKGIYRDHQDHNREQQVSWSGTFTADAEYSCLLIEVGNRQPPTLVESKCTGTGELNFYADISAKGVLRDLAIYVDGKYVGNLNQYFDKPRTCGDTGSLTYKVSCGSHAVKVKGYWVKDSKPYEANALFDLDSACITLPVRAPEKLK